MGKVSSQKKQRDKKKLDKLLQRKAKEDKMRSVLASLAVIAKPGEKKDGKSTTPGEPGKKTDT